ncbi:MraY family glycosyltransferase [Ostreibacterium oceani]|uniref:Fuc2NAc and GlcNAc transferase n=1 Tax=Ostreibacterium oceani TaxID=2654998 RepID=A0A6N7EXR3_9GAMM|nr:glycosyltransferase family 4 protein [Ostreibacterium oceani]MPV85258.1 hypothetical protein [Ostreibacterium oceani]
MNGLSAHIADARSITLMNVSVTEMVVAVIVAGIVASVTAFITWGWIKYSHRKRLLDLPNARSSHQIATPRGGGIAIVVAAVGVFLWGMLWYKTTELLPITAAMLIAAITGWLDDRHQLTAKVKLILTILAVCPLIVGGLIRSDQLQLIVWALPVVIPLWLLGIVALLGLTWVVNLTNFMDGINGITVLQTIFLLLALIILTWIEALPLSSTYLMVFIYLLVSCFVFLPFNFPRAQVFLGDVGSLSLGVLFAWLFVVVTQAHAAGWWVMLILYAVFWVDATVTLVRRFVAGKSLFEAHRSHAYQQLANRIFDSHTKASLLLLGINVGWLLPMAYGSLLATYPLIWFVVAVLPVFVLVICLRAGVDDCERGL